MIQCRFPQHALRENSAVAARCHRAERSRLLIACGHCARGCLRRARTLRWSTTAVPRLRPSKLRRAQYRATYARHHQ
eukprot:6211849-Pleurochrysis_carterae.AAC.4